MVTYTYWSSGVSKKSWTSTFEMGLEVEKYCHNIDNGFFLIYFDIVFGFSHLFFTIKEDFKDWKCLKEK